MLYFLPIFLCLTLTRCKTTDFYCKHWKITVKSVFFENKKTLLKMLILSDFKFFFWNFFKILKIVIGTHARCLFPRMGL